MQRIIILGANGFIGRHLQESLAIKGFDVKGFNKEEVDLTNSSSENQLAEFFSSEDVVIFLSSIAPDRKDSNAFIKNIQMAFNVSRAAKKTPIKHLIYFSSEAVYEFDNLNITEATPTRPTDEYGAMHLIREILLSSDINLKLLILRPVMVYGIEDTHCAYGINKFQNEALKLGKINIFGLGEEKRDCVYINDLVNLLIDLIIRGLPNGVLNIATGVSTSFMDLAKILASSNKSEIKIQFNERKVEIKHKGFNIKKINELCPGFKFTNLKDGIKTLVSRC